MMDLALQLGATHRELGDRMSERELRDWSRYAAQKGLPMQRLEYLLARILMILDLAHMRKPGTTGHLADYLPFAKERSDVERATEALADAFGGGTGGIVIRKRKRRGTSHGG